MGTKDKLKKAIQPPPRKLSPIAKQFLQEALMDAQADREEVALSLIDELEAKEWPALQRLLISAFPDDEETGQALSTAMVEYLLEVSRRSRALARTLSQEPLAVLAQRRRSRQGREAAHG